MPPLFSIGLTGPLTVREEVLSDRADACRVAYVSDLHLRRGRSERLCAQVREALVAARPDVILLGGDLVDAAGELGHLRALVRSLADAAPVFAVGGNHDRWVGQAVVREAVRGGGGEWIHEGVGRVVRHGRRLHIAGPETPASAGRGDVNILCAHYPQVWNGERGRGFDLVLAGHLHGCQVVAFECFGRLFPGALFYTNCCLRLRDGRSCLVVSRGVSDLVPIRWRCPREVVVCHV